MEEKIKELILQRAQKYMSQNQAETLFKAVMSVIHASTTEKTVGDVSEVTTKSGSKSFMIQPGE